MSFSYLIDSGADVSIIKHSVVKTLNSAIKPNHNTRAFVGIGSGVVYTIGVCDLIIVLPTLTLDISFVVVPDHVVPGELDLIIGWDVISQPCLRVEKNADGLKLHYQPFNIPKVFAVCRNATVLRRWTTDGQLCRSRSGRSGSSCTNTK